MPLFLRLERGFLGRGYTVSVCVKNLEAENVRLVVLELLKYGDINSVVYSTIEDERTWIPGAELCIDITVPATVPTGVYWIRASGQLASGGVTKSNLYLVFVDDYDIVDIGDNTYTSAIQYVDIQINDFGKQQMLVPRNADLFVAETSNGKKYYRKSTGETVEALVVAREYEFVWNNLDAMYSYVKSFIAEDIIADEGEASTEQKIDLLLPFFNRAMMAKHGVQRLVCYRENLSLVCKELITVNALLPWTEGGGGGGGAGAAVLAIALGAWTWWQSRRTREEITTVVKETGKQIIDNQAALAKAVIDNQNKTAKEIVRALPDTTFTIPKDILIQKLDAISSETKAEIDRVASIHKANIDMVEDRKEKKWYEDPITVGALGIAAGILLGRGR